MLYPDKYFDLKAFEADAAQWAKDAKQCNCCTAWALLDENGRCSYCWPMDHKHITTTNK